jgi:hypothetical protein
MQAASRPLIVVGLTAIPLLVFLVLAILVKRPRLPTVAAFAAGLVTAAFLAAIHFSSTGPTLGSVWQRLLFGTALPIGAAIPLTLAAAVFHGTRHRNVGVRASAATATWAITLPVGLFVAFFIGCAAGLVCL